MLARVLSKPAPIASAAELGAFLDSRAAFLSQKCVIEFCRVRTSVHWEKLFREKDFQDALTRSCWMSYTPALAMMAELVEGQLRSFAGKHQEDLRTALSALAMQVRSSHALPAGVDEQAWLAQQGLVAERLQAAGLAAPRPIRDIAGPMARLVFEALPLHVDIVANDFDYIFNNLRMNLIRAYEDLLATADLPAVASSLLDR
jgi:hypothetical protein